MESRFKVLFLSIALIVIVVMSAGCLGGEPTNTIPETIVQTPIVTPSLMETVSPVETPEFPAMNETNVTESNQTEINESVSMVSEILNQTLGNVTGNISVVSEDITVRKPEAEVNFTKPEV
jgi:hypothetical protein